MKAERKQGTVRCLLFSPLSPTLSPSQGPADAGLFFTKKHREKPDYWKQLTAKNVIIDREQKAMAKETRNCPVYALMAQRTNRRKT